MSSKCLPLIQLLLTNYGVELSCGDVYIVGISEYCRRGAFCCSSGSIYYSQGLRQAGLDVVV